MNIPRCSQQPLTSDLHRKNNSVSRLSLSATGCSISVIVKLSYIKEVVCTKRKQELTDPSDCIDYFDLPF